MYARDILVAAEGDMSAFVIVPLTMFADVAGAPTPLGRLSLKAFFTTSPLVCPLFLERL